MNISIIKEKCTGCGVCSMVCPKKCIKMEKNDLGFVYPKINEHDCIHCELCIKKCHVLESYNEKKYIQKIRASYTLDNQIYENSASGGIATIIAKKFIENGGIVYGCRLDNHFNTQHIRIDNVKLLSLIQDSKYTQSNITNSFENIKKDLLSNTPILFISTPCQVAAISNLFSNYKNLIYFIDLICHGVTNDDIFKSYIVYLEKKRNIKIINYKYRSKKSSEYERTETIEYIKNKKKRIQVSKLIDSPFYYSYLRGYLSRLSCDICKYKTKSRVGDITLGDYWGYEKEFSSKDKKMFSKVIINSEKGEELFELISNCIKYNESNFKLNIDDTSKTKNITLNKIIKKYAINGEWDNVKKINKSKEFYLKKIYKYVPQFIKKTINTMK